MAKDLSKKRAWKAELARRRLDRATRNRECGPSCPSVMGYRWHKYRGHASCAGSREAWRLYYTKEAKEERRLRRVESEAVVDPTAHEL